MGDDSFEFGVVDVVDKIWEVKFVCGSVNEGYIECWIVINDLFFDCDIVGSYVVLEYIIIDEGVFSEYVGEFLGNDFVFFVVFVLVFVYFFV